MRRCPYEILGLHPGCEPEVLAAAVRALRLKYHPDKNRSGAAQFEIVQLAAQAIADGVRWVETPDHTPGLADALGAIWGPLRRPRGTTPRDRKD